MKTRVGQRFLDGLAKVSNFVARNAGFRAGMVAALFTLGADGCGEPEQLARPQARGGEATASVTSSAPGWATWTKWRDPLFPGQYPATGDPSVIRDGSRYRMFYTGYDVERHGPATCQAVSDDGYVWEPIDRTDKTLMGRVLPRGKKGAWDDTRETSYILKRGDGYLLYFSGYTDRGGSMKSFPALLGLARSKDGRHFERVSPDPIMKPTPRSYDHDAIFSPSIVEHDGTLYMVYTGHCWTDCEHGQGVAILGATSKDGVRWKKWPEPVLKARPEPSWLKGGAGEPELVRGPDGRFYLFITGEIGAGPQLIGLAVSSQPFGPWKINPEPIVRPGSERDAFDVKGVVAPSVLIENGVVRMWFSGFNRKSQIRVGYAEAPWPLVTENQG